MENISKNKRGRPRTIPDELRAFWDMTGHNIGRRHKDNLTYTSYIVRLFYPNGTESEPMDPVFVYLLDIKKDKFKATILSELGRLAVRSGDDITLRAAHVICTREMSTARALAYLRRFKKTKTAAVRSVLFKICRLIDDSLLTAEEKEILRENLNAVLLPQNQGKL